MQSCKHLAQQNIFSNCCQSYKPQASFASSMQSGECLPSMWTPGGVCMQTLVSQRQAGKAQPGYEHWGPAAEKISTKHLFSCQLGTFPSLGCPVSLPQLALASLFIVLCLLHLYTKLKYSPLLLGQCGVFSLSWSDFDVCGSHRDTDVHTVASLLKLYLRELPEPVVPWIQYEDFLLCGQALDVDERKVQSCICFSPTGLKMSCNCELELQSAYLAVHY